MKIYIEYLYYPKVSSSYKNLLLNTENYQSINSIIYQYFTKINKSNSELKLGLGLDLELELNNYFLDYNGQVLNGNYSLEKYNIEENSILKLHRKQKGGSKYSNLIKNPLVGFIIFLIVIMPVALLPSGFLPMISVLLKKILENSFNTLGKYLVCVLGKKTLYKRCSSIIVIIKYVLYIFLVYVVISFPLIILCIALKRKKITDSIASACSAINVGSLAGIVLTMFYFLFYCFYRGAETVGKFLISIFKQFSPTNIILVPILQNLLSLFGKIKHFPVYAVPIIGGALSGYHSMLELLPEYVTIFLSTIVDVGCSPSGNNNFANKLLKNMTNMGCNKIRKCCSDKSIPEPTKKKEEPPPNFKGDEICEIDNNFECCSDKNLSKIGNLLLTLLKTPSTNLKIVDSGYFYQYLFVVEGFFDGAIKELCIKNNESSEKNSIISSIKSYKEKIREINKFGEDFSKMDGSVYDTGDSLFKTLFKMLFLSIFCNVSSTSRSTQAMIPQLGGFKDIIDMLKSGSSTGMIIMLFYVLTVIILCICSLFNVF